MLLETTPTLFVLFIIFLTQSYHLLLPIRWSLSTNPLWSFHTFKFLSLLSCTKMKTKDKLSTVWFFPRTSREFFDVCKSTNFSLFSWLKNTIYSHLLHKLKWELFVWVSQEPVSRFLFCFCTFCFLFSWCRSNTFFILYHFSSNVLYLHRVLSERLYTLLNS